MLDTGTCTHSITTVCVCSWKGGVWGSITHYHPMLLGITVDKVRERERKGENRDLASYPAAFCSAVQLTTQSFGWRRGSEGRNALGGIVAKETVIENLIKLLNKFAVCCSQKSHLNVLHLIQFLLLYRQTAINSCHQQWYLSAVMEILYHKFHNSLGG